MYPTAECRIVPMGQVTTSKGGVRLLECSTAVKIHSWLAMFASFGRTLAPGNGGRGGFAHLTSDDSESTFAGLGQRALIGQMHEGLDKLLAARDQMEQLLRAIVKIGSDLDLDETLHHVVTAALELTGCRYGALATCDPDGNLTSFVHAGMDADTVQRIGSSPVGKGILGVVLDQASALRLDDLTAHPAAVGFPENYPAMRAFLGVPIMVRGNMFGGLYLTDDRPAWTFAESDEVAVQVLASAAAVAIENHNCSNAVSGEQTG